MKPYVPYIARPIRYAGVIEHQGYRIKKYVILYGSAPYQEELFAQGLQRALADLPQPAVTESRPGVGFVLAHQGNGADYVVLGWWDNENELPLRVHVHFPTEDCGWREARDGESVCVWDIEVLWFERQAYVQTVLNGQTVEDYLDRHIG